MLEHRWLRRRTSKVRVQLYRQGEAVGTTCTLDMNSQGLGVECGKLDLHEGETVEIDLPESGIPGGMGLHARCLVIHVARGRCGLMFLDVDEVA